MLFSNLWLWSWDIYWEIGCIRWFSDCFWLSVLWICSTEIRQFKWTNSYFCSSFQISLLLCLLIELHLGVECWRVPKIFKNMNMHLLWNYVTNGLHVKNLLTLYKLLLLALNILCRSFMRTWAKTADIILEDLSEWVLLTELFLLIVVQHSWVSA